MMFALSLQDLGLRYLNAIASLGTILERRPFDGHGHSGTLNDTGDYARDSPHPPRHPDPRTLHLPCTYESLWPLFSER